MRILWGARIISLITTLKYHGKIRSAKYQIESSGRDIEKDQELSEDGSDTEESLDQAMQLISLRKCFELINEGEMSSDEDEWQLKL